jgi:hypothetical protein
MIHGGWDGQNEERENSGLVFSFGRASRGKKVTTTPVLSCCPGVNGVQVQKYRSTEVQRYRGTYSSTAVPQLVYQYCVVGILTREEKKKNLDSEGKKRATPSTTKKQKP